MNRYENYVYTANFVYVHFMMVWLVFVRERASKLMCLFCARSKVYHLSHLKLMLPVSYDITFRALKRNTWKECYVYFVKFTLKSSSYDIYSRFENVLPIHNS